MQRTCAKSEGEVEEELVRSSPRSVQIGRRVYFGVPCSRPEPILSADDNHARQYSTDVPLPLSPFKCRRLRDLSPLATTRNRSGCRSRMRHQNSVQLPHQNPRHLPWLFRNLGRTFVVKIVFSILLSSKSKNSSAAACLISMDESW